MQVLIPNISRESSCSAPSSSNINGYVKKTTKESSKGGAKKAAAAVIAGGGGAGGGGAGGGACGASTAATDADDATAEDLPYWPVLPKINSVNKFPDRTIIIPG